MYSYEHFLVSPLILIQVKISNFLEQPAVSIIYPRKTEDRASMLHWNTGTYLYSDIGPAWEVRGMVRMISALLGNRMNMPAG
jgi:hypothetical protein